MSVDDILVLCVRLAGGLHLVTTLLAWFTPIPPDWEQNLQKLPLIHRRFSIAQNLSTGATIVVLGLFSLCFAPELVGGSPLARALCAATALFWAARLGVLPWLGLRGILVTRTLRLGYRLLLLQCLLYSLAYGYLALRSV